MTDRVGDTAAPPAYPRHWEADVLSSDGGIVHIRPIVPADGVAIREMHRRMSARTLYLRYFSAVGELSDQQLRVYTAVDHASSVCLIAEVAGVPVAAGTYHRHTSMPVPSAEVAFVVEDDQQRRGLGSILLEHLAAAAQENGIRRFTAEVLAENNTMVRVFIDAGYVVKREYESGVIDLEFDIAPTEKSIQVARSREHRAESRSIAGLLNPASVAVIGASDEPSTLGHAVLLNLLRGGFTGPVYPVADGPRSVLGVRAYPSITDVPDAVDLAVLAVPSAEASDVLAACQAKGVRGLVVMSAGLVDLGAADEAEPDGGAREAAAFAQRQMVMKARAAGMRVVGPNCLGLMNTAGAVRMNATPAAVVPPPGRIGLFCQSGALGVAILAEAAERGLGLSTFVSAGNRADVSGNDLLQFWQGDPNTDVVLLYLESFGNPRKFARLAPVLARSKPVIAVKSGRYALTTPGLAASSALISDAAVATLFAQSGVIRTDTLTAGFDVAELLATQPVPAGDRVAVLGNSSALGVLAIDACMDAGLDVVDGAPLDLGVAVAPAGLAAAVRAATLRADVHALVVVYVPPVGATGVEHAAALRAAAADSPVPVLSTFIAAPAGGSRGALGPTPFAGGPAGGGATDGALSPAEPASDPIEQLAAPPSAAARGRSVPSFRTPERAVAALAHAVRYGTWLARPTGEIPDLSAADPPVDASSARRFVGSVRDPSDPERPLTDAELVALLACYGIAVVDFRPIGSAGEAVAAAGELGYPVALKSFDESLRHRLDQSGIRLGLRSDEALTAAYDDLSAVAGPWLYVQAMAERDRAEVPTVFAVTADPSFGALVSFGIGGVATELLHDRAFRAVPLTDADAGDLIAAPRAAPLLDGYRGTRPVNRSPLRDLALRLSALADDLPEISDLRLNPVLAGPAGIAVIGGTARIGPPPARQDTRRRLGA